MNIHKRLDKIFPVITNPAFLTNKGLGNEIGFYIFDYDPKDEILVRDHTRSLLHKLNSPSVRIKTLEIDLYALVLEILDKKNVLKKISQDEQKVGFEAVIKRLKPILKPEAFIEIIGERISDDVRLIFLTGVGKSYPLLRSHTVLNNLHSIVKKQPLLMFFPGEYDHRELKLFGLFKDDNYYRAFKLIE
ncbi:MAG: DUF1788 domain-containing protein [Candidatus Omnitrophica bacterium]|nr:DUF1788 domain-containing protein [Candidatus Omnitrophota bacterium]